MKNLLKLLTLTVFILGSFLFTSDVFAGTPPTVFIANITPSQTTANISGVVSNPGSPVNWLVGGAYFGLSPSPGTNSVSVSMGTGGGGYTVTPTGLTCNTLYYVRAFATHNDDGTGGFIGYSADSTFTTTACSVIYSLAIPASGGTGTGSYGGSIVGDYYANSAVSITATPTGSSTFTRWTASGAAASCNGQTTSPCSFSMTSNASVQAVYTASIFSLAIPASGGTGTGTYGGSIVGDYYANSAVSITATPAGGSTFNYWTASGAAAACNGSASTTCSFSITSNASAQAVYTATAVNCTGTPWGTVASGYSNTAYSSTAPTASTTCAAIAQTRTCTNGTFSGSYVNTSCVQGCPASGAFGNYANGNTVTGYLSSAPVSPTTCSPATRTCTGGTVSAFGSLNNASYSSTGCTQYYTASFNSNGGTPSYSPDHPTAGATVYSPGSPTLSGYTFLGWSPSLPSAMPATNTTYTAQWSINNAIPTVTSPTSSSITDTSATLGANVTSLGIPASISARGTCFGTTSSPTANCASDGSTASGIFTHSRAGLSCNTFYYYRGYASNSTGTGYSSDGTFMTTACGTSPILTSPTSSSIGQTTATLGATVTSLGIPTTNVYTYVCFGTSPSPSAVCAGAIPVYATGPYTIGVASGLNCGTFYYYRGKATNASGTGYSPDGTFTTTACNSTLTIVSPGAISGTYSAPGTYSVTSGASPVVTAAGWAGYTATISGGCSATGAYQAAVSCTVSNMTSNTTVTVTYAIKSFTVSSTVASGTGTITPSSTAVNYNGTTSFNVAPGTYYSTGSVSGCAGSLVGTTYTTGAITADCTVSASFSPQACTGPSGYTACASEGGTCSVAGNLNVAFGCYSSFNYKGATNSIACNNTVFGDPLPGFSKQCFYKTMSGTLSSNAASCTIALNGSSCTTSPTITWGTTNPVGTSAITASGMTNVNGNSGSQAMSVPYGGRTFFLYNDSILLNQTTVTSSCASGTWNGSICAQYTLTVTTAGTGAGTAGPSATYNYNTVVTLTQSASAGSTFSGWSGDADCADGSVTMNAAKICTASFNSTPMSGTLTSNATSCTIALGGSNCTINPNLTWTVTNPVGATTDITASGMTAYPSPSVSGGGPTAFVVPYSGRTFYLYNNAINLAQTTVTSSCASGAWSAGLGICATPPVLSTPVSSSITQTTATIGWTIDSLGVPAANSAYSAYNTTNEPIFENSAANTISVGPKTRSLSGLTCGTTYYFKGAAASTYSSSFSPVGTFTTLSCTAVPIVTTPTVTAVTQTTATLGANVTSLGLPAAISSRGICWGLSPSPSVCTPAAGTTTGVYTLAAASLTPNTFYYYRGFATNSTGTGYSADGTFTTSAVIVNISLYYPTMNVLPSSSAPFIYNVTANIGTTSCQLLDNTSTLIPGYDYPHPSPIAYTSSATAGAYGYYIRCKSVEYPTYTNTTGLITMNVIAPNVTASPTTYNVAPGTSVSFAYTSGTTPVAVGTVECRLLNNVSTQVVTYQAASPLVYAAPNSIGAYGYYVNCRNTTLNTAVATSGLITVNTACGAGTTFNGTTCVAPSGSITASDCNIANNASSCTSNLSWSTSYPITTSSVTTPTGITVATANTSSTTYPVSYGSRSFYLYNNGVQLGMATATASGTPGVNSWDPVSGTFVPPSTGTFSVPGCTISEGSSTCPSAPITWSVANPLPGASTIVRITPGNIDVVPSTLATSGSTPYNLTTTPTTFTLIHGGIILGTVSPITVCAINTHVSGGACVIDAIAAGNTVFTVNDQSITATIFKGRFATLAWSSPLATSCSGTNFKTSDNCVNSVNLGKTTGSCTVSPLVTTTYTLNCTNTSGGTSFPVTTKVITLEIKEN